MRERPADDRSAIHEAITESLPEGEIAVAWTLTIDVAGPDNTRYLAHRYGGGADGNELPMVWTALGMSRAALGVAERELERCTVEVDEPEDEDE